MTIAEKIGLVVVVVMIPMMYMALLSGVDEVVVFLFMGGVISVGLGLFLFGGLGEKEP